MEGTGGSTATSAQQNLKVRSRLKRGYHIYSYTTMDMHGEYSNHNDCCVSADMVSQMLDVLDQRSRQIDYSNFGPHFLPQPQSYEGVQQNESPDPGSSTYTMVPEGTAASGALPLPLAQIHGLEAGLQSAEPHLGSDDGGTLTHQTGLEERTAQPMYDTAVT